MGHSCSLSRLLRTLSVHLQDAHECAGSSCFLLHDSLLCICPTPGMFCLIVVNVANVANYCLLNCPITRLIITR